MGNQQIIMVVLGTIVVATAVAVGITEFRSYHVEAVGDEMQSVLLSMATEAKIYFEKPKTLGGGGGSFAGFALPKNLSSSGGMTYILSPPHASSLAVTGKADAGSMTVAVGTSRGQFSILWAGTGPYHDRTRSTQPF